jgi:hypothetical protein
MSKETHIYVKYKVQVEENTPNHKIRESFDNRLLNMSNLNPLPFMKPSVASVKILSVATTHIVDESESINEKHLIVNMCVREGCRTYDIKKVVTVPSEMSQDDIEKKVIFNEYGEVTGTIDDEGSSYMDNSGYYYDNGEYAVICDDFKEVTQEEFEVLNKFL